MKYRKLGRTGFEVSDVAHGLWGMSGWSGSDDRESLASMQLGIDLGCNFFDMAWAYGDGKSDGLLGEMMARNSGEADLRGVENSSGERAMAGAAGIQVPRCFFGRACVPVCRHDPQAVAGGYDRRAAVSRVGRHLD